eukprot:COSAG04_NODE_537_length_12906_cov_3.938705_7_plen_464_part_00
MGDGEEYSEIATTRLEAGLIALGKTGLFAKGWVKEPVVLHHLARIGVYSPELCGDEAALSKAFAAHVQHRFRPERRALLGFKRRGFEFTDAKGSRVTVRDWCKLGPIELGSRSAVRLAQYICETDARLGRVTAALERHMDLPHAEPELALFSRDELLGLCHEFHAAGLRGFAKVDQEPDDSPRLAQDSKRRGVEARHRQDGTALGSVAGNAEMLRRSEVGGETFTRAVEALTSLLQTGAFESARELQAGSENRRLWKGLGELTDIVQQLEQAIALDDTFPYMDEEDEEHEADTADAMDESQPARPARPLAEALPRLGTLLDTPAHDDIGAQAYLCVGLRQPDGRFDANEVVLGPAPTSAQRLTEREVLASLGSVLADFRFKDEARGPFEPCTTMHDLTQVVKRSAESSCLFALMRGMGTPLGETPDGDERLGLQSCAAAQIALKMMKPNAVPASSATSRRPTA